MAIESTEQKVDVLRETIVALVRRDGPDLSARQLGVFLTCYREDEAQTVRGLERFPLGLNRDSQWARKCGVSADDSVSGMRFAAASDSSCDGCPPKPAPTSSLTQDMLQHDRNPL